MRAIMIRLISTTTLSALRAARPAHFFSPGPCGKINDFLQGKQCVSSDICVKSTHMKQFSLLVRVPQDYAADQARAVNPEWGKLIEEWKVRGVYVLSFAFPGESLVVSGKKGQVKHETVLSNGLRAVSNIVLQAETLEEASALARSCPVLSHGGTVEVREIMNPVPVAP